MKRLDRLVSCRPARRTPIGRVTLSFSAIENCQHNRRNSNRHGRTDPVRQGGGDTVKNRSLYSLLFAMCCAVTKFFTQKSWSAPAAGEEQEVKFLYSDGLARRTGPEPCAVRSDALLRACASLFPTTNERPVLAHSFRTGIERGTRASGSTPALRCVLCRVKLGSSELTLGDCAPASIFHERLR